MGTLGAMDELAEDLRTVVARLVRHLRTSVTALPSHQASVLRQIESHGPQTASQLAVREAVRPQSMAHTLQQLDRAGHITRDPDPTDRRQTLVGLSEPGRAAIELQRRDVTDWLSQAIEEGLNADERARLADGVALLARMVDLAGAAQPTVTTR
jgi:DNA-binding MarR family transcriptional regulator